MAQYCIFIDKKSVPIGYADFKTNILDLSSSGLEAYQDNSQARELVNNSNFHITFNGQSIYGKAKQKKEREKKSAQELKDAEPK